MATQGHRLLGLVALALLAAVGGCSSKEASVRDDPDRPAAIEAGGVRVAATFEESESLVRVHFAPLRPGFHIYSLSLPEGGIDGLGIPTRVAAGNGLRSLGPARATVPSIPLRLAALGVTLPVYPDGPVDVLLPVDADRPSSSTVVVTYGACSEDVCLVPVRDLAVPVSTSD